MLADPVEFTIHVKPQGAVRMTQRGKWTSASAQRYLSYKQVISLEARKHFKEPIKGPVEVGIFFYVPAPKKMPKGRTRPTTKPDIDNMIKGVFDALNKIAWKDDAQVIRVVSAKHYFDTPHISITVEEAS